MVAIPKVISCSYCSKLCSPQSFWHSKPAGCTDAVLAEPIKMHPPFFINTQSNNVSARKAFKPLALLHAIIIMAKVVAVKGRLHNPSANRNPNHFTMNEIPVGVECSEKACQLWAIASGSLTCKTNS